MALGERNILIFYTYQVWFWVFWIIQEQRLISYFSKTSHWFTINQFFHDCYNYFNFTDMAKEVMFRLLCYYLLIFLKIWNTTTQKVNSTKRSHGSWLQYLCIPHLIFGKNLKQQNNFICSLILIKDHTGFPYLNFCSISPFLLL